jgi:hypothetical protein
MKHDYVSKVNSLVEPEPILNRKRPKSSNTRVDPFQTSNENDFLQTRNERLDVSPKIGSYDWKQKSMVFHQKKKRNDEKYDRIYRSKFTIIEPEAEAVTFNRFNMEHKHQRRPKSAQCEAKKSKSASKLDGLVSQAFIDQLEGNYQGNRNSKT